MQFPSKIGRPALAAFLAAAIVLSTRAVEPDKYLPSGSEVVLAINVQQILNSPLVKKYAAEEFKKQLESDPEAKKFFAAVGLDPLKDIHKIVVGLWNSGGMESKMVAAVHGTFDPDKFNAAIAEEAKSKGDEIKILTKGDLKIYEFRSKDKGKRAAIAGTPLSLDDKPLYAAFVDKGTLIVSLSAEQTEATVKKGGGKLSADMLAALDRIGGNESVYGALAITDQMKKGMESNQQMKDLATKLQFITGTFDLNKDFKFNLAVQTADAKAAEKVKTMINQFVPFLGVMASGQAERLGPAVTDLVKQIKVAKDDKNAVTVSLTVTEEMMKEMEENAKNALKAEKENKTEKDKEKQ